MDHLNKTLLLSLKQDLVSLNESIERLSVDKDLASWLFPTKNHQFVKRYIKDKKIFELNDIKIILELIIDRLYVGIRLILMLIQDNVKTNDFGSCLILQPQQMTIGCSFENLRKLIGQIIEKLNDQNFPIKNPNYSDRIMVPKTKKHETSQTDIICLEKCDSCASALSCMKNLLILFEIHKDDIYQTEQMKSNIYDLTQFGCMMQTAMTIEKSLKNILEKLIDKENENDELNQKIKNLKKEIQRKNGKIALLEQECGVLNEKNKRNSSEMANLKLKMETLTTCLTKNDFQITYLNTHIESLSTNISLFKKESDVLKKENSNLSENFERIRKIVKQFIDKLPVVETNLLKIEKEHEYVLTEFEVLSNACDNLNQYLTKVNKKNNTLENKTKMLCCDFKENATNLSKDFKNFKEKIQQMIIQSHVNDVKTTDSIPKIQIKGNPMEDIARQIEENNERMRILQNENNKLESIISKFKNLKK